MGTFAPACDGWVQALTGAQNADPTLQLCFKCTPRSRTMTHNKAAAAILSLLLAVAAAGAARLRLPPPAAGPSTVANAQRLAAALQGGLLPHGWQWGGRASGAATGYWVPAKQPLLACMPKLAHPTPLRQACPKAAWLKHWQGLAGRWCCVMHRPVLSAQRAPLAAPPLSSAWTGAAASPSVQPQ